MDRLTERLTKLAAYEDIGTVEEFKRLSDADKEIKQNGYDICTIQGPCEYHLGYPKKQEPLTVEELRQMDGLPVYTITGLHLPCPNDKWWGIVYLVPESKIILLYGVNKQRAVEFEAYGKTWLAYRSKPEVETE